MSASKKSPSGNPRVKFPLGRLVMTPGAREAIPHSEMWDAIRRHESGDWGEIDAHDRRENDLSLKKGFRIVSVYHSSGGTKFYVITEADRASTCVLLPDEY